MQDIPIEGILSFFGDIGPREANYTKSHNVTFATLFKAMVGWSVLLSRFFYWFIWLLIFWLFRLIKYSILNYVCNNPFRTNTESNLRVSGHFPTLLSVSFGAYFRVKSDDQLVISWFKQALKLITRSAIFSYGT